MRRLLVLIQAVLALAGIMAWGQNVPIAPKDYWVDTWTTDHGLPQNSVTTLLQSREGYLWLGTHRGLVRYDGSHFTVFNSANTPALRERHDHVTDLTEDASGTLWVGTDRGGVVQFKDGTFTVLGTSSGLGDLRVSALCSDTDTNLWVATESGGLHRLREGEFTSYSMLRDYQGHRARKLLPASRGRIWLATSSQFGLIEDGKLNFLAESPARAPDAVQIGNASDGGLWVAFNDHLLKYDAAGSLEKDCGAFLPGGITATISFVREDRKGQVWIGTNQRGLYLYAEGQFISVNKDKMTGQALLGILNDREGNIWLGSEGGLSRLKERLFDLYEGTTTSGSMMAALAVCEARSGGLWAGFKGGGLRHWKNGRMETVSLGTRPDNVWALCEDSKTNLWVGTDTGLWRITEGVPATNYGIATASLAIRALFEDSQGRLWIGTKDAGIHRLSEDSLVSFSEREGLSNNEVRAFAEDSQGSLWIATVSGLNRFKDGRFETFTTTNGLPSDNIRTLYFDTNATVATLWVGTGRGLACLRDGRWSSFTSRTYLLPDDLISQIVDDQRSNLWIGSNKGVYRLRKFDLEAAMKDPLLPLPYVPYGASDGLKSLECSGDFQPAGTRTSDGRLWFPTTDGLATLELDKVPQTDFPLIAIEALAVDGEPVSLQAPVKVALGAVRVEFAYTGFNFSAPSRLRFQYKLDGFDADWVDGGSGRRAVYPGLPPGRYTFRVKAGNLDGRWNELGKTLEFVVLPPFWRTWWFYSLAGLLTAALAVTTYRYIAVLRLRRQLRILEQQQALERERARIAKDVHDDLGARLTQIGIIGELIRRDATARPETTELAGKLTRATREVSEAVDEIVWAVNPQNDTLDRLVPYLLHYAEEFLEPTPIRYRLDAPKHLPPIPIKSDARHNLFLVLKEALNNAVKHAQATEVQIQITFQPAGISIEVRDNGTGFDPATASTSRNGLANMRRRLEDIGGQFTLTSQPGQGTRIRCTLKLK